jgi:hypothetical protein
MHRSHWFAPGHNGVAGARRARRTLELADAIAAAP